MLGLSRTNLTVTFLLSLTSILFSEVMISLTVLFTMLMLLADGYGRNIFDILTFVTKSNCKPEKNLHCRPHSIPRKLIFNCANIGKNKSATKTMNCTVKLKAFEDGIEVSENSRFHDNRGNEMCND